ncbi:MAG: LysR family transcriptional regulator [Burkholderiaceae bacterium]
MFTTDDLKFLASLSRSTSLAQAARTLGVTPPALSQRLKALEKRLGTALVVRTTRRLALTPVGELVVDKSNLILDQIDATWQAAREQHRGYVGLLRVRAPTSFGRTYVAAAIAGFRTMHPDVEIQLLLSERPLAEHDDSDVIVNAGPLGASSMVAYPLARNARWLCAAPAYLAGRPPLRTPGDLGKHHILGLQENDDDSTLWRFRSGSSVRTFRARPSLLTNDGTTLTYWTLSGLGIALRSEWDAASHVAEGRLVRVLRSWTLPDADIVALVPAKRQGTERVRGFVRYLQQRLGPTPPWR